MSPHKGKKYPPEVLTPDEVERLIRACSMRAKSGIRNRALIVLLYRSGLRLSEALALMPKDLDLVKGSVRVLHGKGDQARTVGIDPAACSVLAHWLEVRKGLTTKRAPVFCTLKGGWIDSSYIRHMFYRLACKAKIAKRVHAHGLRHTHAAELMDEGVPMNVISGQLGHSSIAVTHRYVNHINPKARIETMQSREWAFEV